MSPAGSFFFTLSAAVSLTFGEPGCEMQGLQVEGYTRSGDFILGGIFPIHFSSFTSTFAFTELKEVVQCHTFRILEYQRLLAMIFAVEEINEDAMLLPDATLGFRMYDSCLVAKRTLKGAMWMVTGGEAFVPQYCCLKRPPLAAIVGDAASRCSVPIARVLGVHRYPQISYGSTVSLLSDKHQFPSFLRTIPSDNYQSRVIARLIGHFGWTWVGIVAEETDYGQLGSQVLREELGRYSACAAFYEGLPVVYSERRISHLIGVIWESQARVIVGFSSMDSLLPLLKEMTRLNITGKVWIASEGWSTAVQVLDPQNFKVLNGTLGIVVQKSSVPGFRDFLLGLRPSLAPSDIFMSSFWEEVFGCQWPKNGRNQTSTDGKPCDGTEKLVRLNSTFLNEAKFSNAATSYKAVYAIGHALHNLRACTAGDGPFRNKSCADKMDFQPWQLLHYMKSVRFQTKAGEEVYFDVDGNPPPAYEIINWIVAPEGLAEMVVVGSYQAGDPSEHQLTINMSKIFFGGYEEIPQSSCSEKCGRGFRKSTQEGQSVCCYDCIPCSEGEITNQTDSPECIKCSDDQWSNEKRDRCVPKTIEFLSFQEPLGCILAAVASASAMIPAAIFFVFYKHRETPIVKANNRGLSCLLLVALSLCLLSTLLFLGRPTDITCMLRQVTFSILFVLCISCLLAKTVLVLMAFRATHPNARLRKGLGPKIPTIIICACTLIQTLVCVAWLASFPPYAEQNMKSLTRMIVVECNEGSPTAFWCILGYMSFLAFTSFLVAFHARKLPDSFNEAQLITFSMVTFLTVWTLFLPAYQNTRGKYMVAVEIFTIVSSSLGIVVCIFAPKCYIILIRPDLNSRDYLKRKGSH